MFDKSTFFYKTNPIFPIIRLKIKIIPKNKPNTNPIQTQSKPIPERAENDAKLLFTEG
jgi:hypothetical protein